ncbi:hypothetical protein LTLLF_145780 [Microtus ochrogaster]|uniref:Uncharacterized protein n=1 Tax=Microtus ochrogaster TaxID=79684 RepID=A0A8J6GM56_MICOH|nr:hypothetical protein LTLLF_145780 [Microtus ochrogaster]
MAFSRRRPEAPGPRRRPRGLPGMTTKGFGNEQEASSLRRRTRQARSLEAGPGPRRRERAAGLGRGGGSVQGRAGAGTRAPRPPWSPAAESEITARGYCASGRRSGRTLRTLRMNDDSSAHSLRTLVTAGGFVRARWGPSVER